jgi:hypothetical protein
LNILVCTPSCKEQRERREVNLLPFMLWKLISTEEEHEE